MFGLFRRSHNDESTEKVNVAPVADAPSATSPDMSADDRLIAVISAAIARFREAEAGVVSDAGFVVRRIRRV